MKIKLFVCVILCFSSLSMAAGTWWQGPAGGNWMTASNWDAGVPSGALVGIVSYYNGYDPMVVVDSASPACDNVRISDNTNGMATVNVNTNGILWVNTSIIAGYSANSDGILNVNNGGSIAGNTAPGMILGLAAGSYGELNIANGGAATFGNLVMARGGTTSLTGGSGSLSLVNGAALNVNGNFLMGDSVNNGGSMVTMTGGTITMSKADALLAVGYRITSNLSQFDMSGGTLNMTGNTSKISIGDGYGGGNATGIFNISGGTVSTSTITVGRVGTGTLNLSDSGVINTKDILIGESSSHPDCVVNMTGGQINAASTISVGYGGDAADNSVLNISGGSFDAYNLIVARNGKGTMTISGSDASIVTDNLYIGGYNDAVANATVEFNVGADGVTAIEVTNAVNFDLGDISSVAELLVSLTSAPQAGNILLVDNQSAGSVIGTFDYVNGITATEGASVVLTYGGMDYNYTLTYQGIAGTDNVANDIMLVIPEPATVVLLALGSLLFAKRR